MFVDVWQNSNNMVTRTVTTSLQERTTLVNIAIGKSILLVEP